MEQFEPHLLLFLPVVNMFVHRLKPLVFIVVRCLFCVETFPTVIVGAACGAGVLLLLIAIAACVILKAMHNRHDYEG